MRVILTSVVVTVLAVFMFGSLSQVADASTPPAMVLYITDCFSAQAVQGASVTAVIKRGGETVDTYGETSNSAGYVTFNFLTELENGDQIHVAIDPQGTGGKDTNHLYFYSTKTDPAGRYDINQPFQPSNCYDNWEIEYVVINAVYVAP